MGDPNNPAPEPAVDLTQEVEKRKTWFHECHLRSLNLDSFRGITELDRQKTASDAFPDDRISLVSEPMFTWSFGTRPVGGSLKNAGRVYLDDQQPVWTDDERTRHDTFQESFFGRIDNWLGYKDGRRLSAALNDLKQKYEQSAFSSITDLGEDFITFARTAPGSDAGSMGRALSRATLAGAKPWLIGELYNSKNPDPRPIENWIGNIEQFLDNFEADIGIALGGIAQKPLGPALDADAYRAWIKFLFEAAPTRDASGSLQVKMLELIPNKCDSKVTTYAYNIRVQTNGYPMGPLDHYPFSENLKYWVDVMKNSLGEAYVNKPNADMGLCHIMRTIYLFGTLPSGLGSDADLTWRKRATPDDAFNKFFNFRAGDKKLQDDPDLQDRLQKAQTKLRILLEESASHPRGPAPMFSPLAQELARQALHSFKFWLDESPQVKGNSGLLKARSDTGIVTSEEEKPAEMEYWSENHYIMFASSEFLAGQLWESDTFQPCEEFRGADDKTGILTGKQRKERGRARVLKWLNNKLLFGWMEFNSSGYYREHLWSLLNLADFSLDKEIRDKAALVIDLMLFDVARFLHKGTMGAAGGRSQFKSKSSGWDNALCDVVEILYGPRGVFSDADSQIGSALATSTYKVPEVLLEIGSNPPATPFTDRSRVSITFEEAPKYGISYSQDSDQKDSVMQGYAPKRAQHFPFLDQVNQAIAQAHSNYGSTEDDTVFWWGCSAFYTHQTVRGTFHAVKTFGLDSCPVFKGALPLLIRLVAGYEKAKHRAILGGIIGGLLGSVGIGVVAGVGESLVEDFFESDDTMHTLEESSADELSVLLEGSVRTRVNLFSYRSPAVMLASAQNFRAGQLNFQSSVCQASVHPSLNVFTTAGLEDLDISDLDAALGGGIAGGLLGAAVDVVTGGLGGVAIPALAGIGAAAGVIVNRAAATHQHILVDHGDGPGWWTGSWSLPMIAQHGPAAILAYDFHDIQGLLAKCGSHAWFPKSGFDRVDEMRTSAYDDADFPLLDIGDIGPKGFWVFGKYTHPSKPGSHDRKEAYVGVFSSQRPEWQDQTSDFYKEQLKEQVQGKISKAKDDLSSALDDIEDKIGSTGRDFIKAAVDKAVQDSSRENITQDEWNKAANAVLASLTDILVVCNLDKAQAAAQAEITQQILPRIWPDPPPQDYFAGRDWYVKGKNIWIVQVGTSDEFTDFQDFKERVSKARVHISDSGNMECSYDIQLGGGSSERLTLDYSDGGTFSLNGGVFQTDLYPRFENPFLRGGRVEWGQREYVIEYNGKSLLHDFTDFANPVRQEQPQPQDDERNLVKALVIFIKTEDENMDNFTVATADVAIGCDRVTVGQVVAAGPVDENTYHDAEWIFFDFPAPRQPDMSITLTHPPSSKGDDTPHWKMSFQLFALMGDRIVRACAPSRVYFEFKDSTRATSPFPFSITLLDWRPWQPIFDSKSPIFWRIGRQQDSSQGYYDYTDLLAVDFEDRLWHRRLMACPAEETGWFAVTRGLAGGAPQPDLTQPFFMAAVSAHPGALYLAIQSGGTLFANRPTPSGAWSDPWIKIDVWIYPDSIFGFPEIGAPPIPVALSGFSPIAGIPLGNSSGVELTLLASDGQFYSRVTAEPIDTGAWRKIEVSGFSAMAGVEFVVTGDFLVALASDWSLWATKVDHSGNHLFPAWEKVSAHEFPIVNFTAIEVQGSCQIVAVMITGNVRAATYNPGAPTAWSAVDLPNTLAAFGSGLASASPSDTQAKFFATGADSKVYALDWDSVTGWAPGLGWTEVAPKGIGIDALTRGGMASLSRVKGQVELYAQGKDASIQKAWWS
jgi:hypothetical protein